MSARASPRRGWDTCSNKIEVASAVAGESVAFKFGPGPGSGVWLAGFLDWLESESETRITPMKLREVCY